MWKWTFPSLRGPKQPVSLLQGEDVPLIAARFALLRRGLLGGHLPASASSARASSDLPNGDARGLASLRATARKTTGGAPWDEVAGVCVSSSVSPEPWCLVPRLAATTG